MVCSPAEEVFADLDLARERWLVERDDMPGREATAPAGKPPVVTDNVRLVRRVAD